MSHGRLPGRAVAGRRDLRSASTRWEARCGAHTGSAYGTTAHGLPRYHRLGTGREEGRQTYDGRGDGGEGAGFPTRRTFPNARGVNPLGAGRRMSTSPHPRDTQAVAGAQAREATQSKVAWRERAGASGSGSAASFSCRASPLGSIKLTVLLSDSR